MAEIPSNIQKIDTEEVKTGAAISEATQTKMGATINGIIDNRFSAVGDIVPSILTVAQFQALRGNNWVLMSGQNIAGSDLALVSGVTTLPNATTTRSFFRQTNDDVNLLGFETSQNLAHRHVLFNNIPVTITSPTIINSPTDYATAKLDRSSFNDQDYQISRGPDPQPEPNAGRTSSEGGLEARPVNYQVNFFIKINELPT